MDDMCVAASAAPVTLVQATVVRQFAGSRVERQLLSQVFDLVWPIVARGASRDSLRDHGGNSSPIDVVVSIDAFAEGASR